MSAVVANVKIGSGKGFMWLVVEACVKVQPTYLAVVEAYSLKGSV